MAERERPVFLMPQPAKTLGLNIFVGFVVGKSGKPSISQQGNWPQEIVNESETGAKWKNPGGYLETRGGCVRRQRAH